MDEAAARWIPGHEVAYREGGLAEEAVTTLPFEHHDRPLDGSEGSRRHAAIIGLEDRRLLRAGFKDGAEVLEVEEEKAAVIRDAEDDGKDLGLDLGKAEGAAKEERTHLGDGGAEGMALLAEDVPEGRGQARPRLASLARGLDGRVDLRVAAFRRGAARRRDAGEVALCVGEEDRHALVREALGQGMEGDRLARASGPGDDAMAVDHGAVKGDEAGRGAP